MKKKHTYSDIHVLNATHTMISVNISLAQNCVFAYFVVMDHSDDSFASSLHHLLMNTVKQIQKAGNNSTKTNIGDCLWRKWCTDEINSNCHNPAVYSVSFLSDFLTYAASNDCDESFATSLHLILVSTVKQIQKIGNKSKMTKSGDCLWRKGVADKGNSCYHNLAIYSLSFLSEFIAYATKINDVNELLAMSAKKKKISEVIDSL